MRICSPDSRLRMLHINTEFYPKQFRPDYIKFLQFTMEIKKDNRRPYELNTKQTEIESKTLNFTPEHKKNHSSRMNESR